MKKVKLPYHPVAERRSNEIAYEVSSDHVNAVNKSIERKIERNRLEQQDTPLNAKHCICKE